MNTPFFIAKRLFTSGGKKQISGPSIRIAMAAIALGLAVMIITVAIVTGFKSEIRKQITGLSGHITVTSFDSNNSWEMTPLDKNQDFCTGIKPEVGFKHIQIYATKAGIIRTEEELQGIVLKGIGSDFDWSYIESNLKDGEVFGVIDSSRNNKVVISAGLASKLRLKTGDEITTYFIQQPPRVRKFMISGIYQNNIEYFDDIVFCDIGQIRRLNGWDDTMTGGFEILTVDFGRIDDYADQLRGMVGYRFSQDGTPLMVETVQQKYPQFFNWLSLFDTNTWVILSLMTLVAVINMVTGLLILILERTNMIGILKAMGSDNWSIRKIFIYQAGFLSLVAMMAGNLAGLGLIWLQTEFGLFTLDPESYYVSVVPVQISLFHIFLLNAGTMLVILLVMILPSWMVTRISPARAIRFD